MKVSIPLAKAELMAARIAEALNPFCARLEIAGSIRRRRPCVGDIDMVAECKDFAGLRARARQNASIVLDGEQNFIVRLISGLEVNVFVAQPERRDLLSVSPSNWGCILLSRTGSREHNRWLCVRAQERGLHWNPYRGVLRGDALIASASEAEIFQALDLDFIKPEDRER